MNRSIYKIMLLLLFVVQLFVPAHMIYQQEETINTGTAYKFKTQPIDPSDPFRGKFIVLSYEIESFQTNEGNWVSQENIFVYLRTNKEGFAEVKTVSKTLLDSDDDYVMAKIYSAYGGTLSFEFPFDRFYMNENKAYDAEVAVRSTQVDSSRICYAQVFVKDGTAVLENVFIDGTPIQEFVGQYQQDVDE